MKTRIPPPVIGLVTAVLIWAFSRYLPQYAVEFPGRSLIAGGFLGLGMVMDLIAIGTFRKAHTTINPLRPEKANELVMSGFYKFTRNPMYLGMLFVLIGWSIWRGNLLAIIPLIGFVIYITYFQIKPEEAALRKRFGDSYANYCKKVRRWL